MTVEGDAAARLLPFPSVTFSDVRVAGAGGEPAMTVETFSMDAELAPFMRGELLIFDMRLVRPRAVISVAEDGTVDWAVRPSTPMDPSHIALERLTISDGEVELRHAPSGRTHLVSNVDAEVSARTLAGPWRLEATLDLDGMATALSVSTGAVEEGRMRLRVRADPAAYPFTLETDGEARIEDGRIVYGGPFKLNARTGGREEPRGTDPAAATNVAAAAPAYRLGGAFELGHRRLEIPEFQLETGPLDDPYTADGSAFIDLGPEPRFSISADGAQIRFDDGGEAQEGGIAFGKRLEAFRTFAAALPKPAIPGSVEVNLPAIVAGDTTIRSVELSAEPAERGWTVNAFRALLPGRTTLEADGLLRTGEDFGFEGSLLLAVGQPSGFAAWVAKDVDDAIRRLPGAGFSAEVQLDERQQQFRNLELVLGQARFEGELDIVREGEARPSMLLRIDGGELDVDGLTAFAALFVSDEGASRFAGHDLDLQVTAGPVHAAGVTAGKVDTALRLKEGQLEIDRLAITDLAGAAISATGTIRDFPADPKGNVDASLVAVDLAPLVRVLAERYPQNPAAAFLRARADAFPGFFDNANIDLVASAAEEGDGTSFALSAHGSAGGTSFNVTANGEGSPGAIGEASITASFNASNEDSAGLMALYGLPALPVGLLGQGETSVALQGALREGLGTEFSFQSDGLEIAFDGMVRRDGEGFAAEGAGRLRTDDLEPWLMTAGVALPGMGLGLPAELESGLSHAGGVLTLGGLKGSVAGDPIAGELKAEAKDGIPHLTGSLSLDAFDLELAAAMVLGDAALQGGDGVWPDVPFETAIQPPFTADLTIEARSLSAGHLASADNARFGARLDGEGLAVTDLAAELHGGRISGLFELKNNEGTGLFSGQLRLDGADLKQALPETGLSGQADFTATMTASGKSVGAMMASVSGSGTAAVADLGIAGLNPQAFAPIVARADQIGRNVDAAMTARFTPQFVEAGDFRVEEAELAFTIAGGVVRTPPLRLEHPQAAINADLRADLPAGTVQATGQVVYDAGTEALVGAEPAVNFTVEGPLAMLDVRLDTTPLAQFLTQRALEREQARVEAMQAALLERQRLRREVRYYAALEDERVRRREAERLQAEEEARRRAEAQARLRAAEEERARAEEEARRQQEEQRRAEEERARLEAEEEARRSAEEAAPRPPSEIERAPLAPPPSSSAPSSAPGLPGVQNPFDETSIERLLQSLE